MKSKNPTIDCTIESIKLKNKADKKPSTWNPSTNPLHIHTIKALITKENNPNVSIVIGNAINFNTGFTIRLSMDNTIKTIIEEPKPSTDTPGK